MLRLISIALLASLLATPARSQMSYCKDIGHGKTYCSGGTIIQQHGRTTIISGGQADFQPYNNPPNPLLSQGNGLPTLAAPYSPAGTQGMLVAPSATALQPVLPAPASSPALAVPQTRHHDGYPQRHGGIGYGGHRICHQFGNTLVCN